MRATPPVADASLASLYDALASEHRAACAAGDEVIRDLRFGDRTIRLTFAGTELSEVLTAGLAATLLHDGGGDATIDATIGLWEARACPDLPVAVTWSPADVGPGGLVGEPAADGVIAVHETASDAITVADLACRAILHRVPSHETIPWWERTAPLRPALFSALGGDRRHLIHAGAVGDERGAVLLAGASGSGKTTVALATLEHGLSYLSDDYVLLDCATRTATAVYHSAKLDEGHLRRFPALAPAVTFPPPQHVGEKAVLDVSSLAGRRLRGSLPVAAVAVPRIRGGETAVRRAGRGEALLALAPSTVLQLPFDEGGALPALAELVREVPCYTVDVGDDMGELAEAVDRCLEQATANKGNR